MGARCCCGTVNPPNLSPSLLGGQCVQHSEDWGGADPGANEDHGTPALPQRKAATRGAHVENIACLNPRIDVGSGGAIRLTLDADAIAILARRARQRIAAQESGLVETQPQPQYDILPRERSRQRLTVARLQDERSDIAYLVFDGGLSVKKIRLGLRYPGPIVVILDFDQHFDLLDAMKITHENQDFGFSISCCGRRRRTR
jgi:hypothetical protein